MTVGARLKEERKRLAKNQTELASIGGVQISAQTNYENDKRAPDADYLAAIATIGADIQYIVTGQRQGQGLGEATIHQAVLDAVDLLSLDKKVDAQQLAKAVTKLCAKATSPPEKSQLAGAFEGSMQIFHQAPAGDIAGRDIVKTEKTRKG